MLELNVDVWVKNHKHEKGHDPSDSHLPTERIDSYPVSLTQDPITLIRENEESNEVRILLAWEVYVTINPRSRAVDQSIMFVAMGMVVAILGGIMIAIEGKRVKKVEGIQPKTDAPRDPELGYESKAPIGDSSAQQTGVEKTAKPNTGTTTTNTVEKVPTART